MQSLNKLLIIVLSFIVILTLPIMVFADNGNGKKISAEHRSRVAEIVQQLTLVAGKDKNIGEEVRQIAQAEATTTETQAAIIEKIEVRGKVKTFLFGTDYKNLGALRSTLVTTANHLNRLQKALERATSTPELQAELAGQITALQEAKAKVESFIKLNESKLSLFGWIVKLFNR